MVLCDSNLFWKIFYSSLSLVLLFISSKFQCITAVILHFFKLIILWSGCIIQLEVLLAGDAVLILLNRLSRSSGFWNYIVFLSGSGADLKISSFMVFSFLNFNLTGVIYFSVKIAIFIFSFFFFWNLFLKLIQIG